MKPCSVLGRGEASFSHSSSNMRLRVRNRRTDSSRLRDELVTVYGSPVMSPRSTLCSTSRGGVRQGKPPRRSRKLCRLLLRLQEESQKPC